jgi:hypothetical protein
MVPSPIFRPVFRSMIKVLAIWGVILLVAFLEAAAFNFSISFIGGVLIFGSLVIVGLVIVGLTLAFGEEDSQRMVAGIAFGAWMAIGAVNFVVWVFS